MICSMQKKQPDTRRIDYGKTGEAIAMAYLEQNGFEILETNYRTKMGEIDVIAKKSYIKRHKPNPETRIHFVEVKSRTNNKFMMGREAVTVAKQRTIRKVAEMYLLSQKLYNKIDVSFDVLEITGTAENHTIEYLAGCF